MQPVAIWLKRSSIVYFAVALATALSACGGSSAPAPAPLAVKVSRPLQKEVVELNEYPSRLESPRTVTLAARVSGLIVQAPFQEGALVKEGDLLFVIDDRPFKAELASRDAEIASARSQLGQAESRFNRYEKLKGTKAISEDAFEETRTAYLQAKAAVGVAEAAREVARLNLEWTKVIAPVSGRVSKKSVTEGNLVSGGAGQTTELTTITSVDPMFAYANVPERVVLKYRDLMDKKKAADADSDKQEPSGIPCFIKLETERVFGHEGHIDFIDNQVDPRTGTIQIRGVIPNSDGRLTAGLFARLQVPGSDPYQALLVPDAAINTDQDSRYLLIAGKDDLVERKSVKLGALFGKLRAIAEGITSEDRVLVSSLQQARVGTKVAPTEVPVAQEETK